MTARPHPDDLSAVQAAIRPRLMATIELVTHALVELA